MEELKKKIVEMYNDFDKFSFKEYHIYGNDDVEHHFRLSLLYPVLSCTFRGFAKFVYSYDEDLYMLLLTSNNTHDSVNLLYYGWSV